MNFRLFRLLPVCIAFSASSAFADNALFTIDDYFKLKRVMELALSSDGELIAYAVEHPSFDENDSVRTVYFGATAPFADPILIDKIQNARSLAWVPETHELAYLSSVNGVTQLYSINTKTKKVRQHTRGTDSVVAFQFSPDGETLAWLRQSQSEKKSLSLYERLYHGADGIVIDSENTVVYEFINPDWPNLADRPQNTLRLRRAGGDDVTIDAPGRVQNFYWSPDASKLSVTYVADTIPNSVRGGGYTSVGVVNVAARTFKPLAHADMPSEAGGARRYAGGEWAPDSKKLIIRRAIVDSIIEEVDTDWTLIDLEKEASFEREETDWHEMDAVYYEDPQPTFIPTPNAIYSNQTVAAKRFLYRFDNYALKRADFLSEVNGSVSLFQFSADYKSAVFVNESIDRPPEIFRWRDGEGVAKLTQLNDEIAEKDVPSFKEAVWKSKDGFQVQGWLLMPPGGERGGSWPLVTFIHGGPQMAIGNEFADYFSRWPYPFELYALNGIAVFLPNYRGSATFGRAFRNPARIDGEPVNDIVSGVSYLVDEGIANPDRLAISGHSHGAWLAPLVMTRAKIFQAGSFAEGTQNKIVNYSLMPGWLNRAIHDKVTGVSLYDDPQRYIDASPDLHFKGLDTAVLFEAGGKSLAVAMMGSPKAAARAGVPTEFVVYPKTGHNPTLPSIQKEIATRNLDWFRFWLQGYEDPDLEKGEQYVRWRKMRDEQCTRLKDNKDAPWYCRQ